MDLRQLTLDLIEDALGMWRHRWAALGLAWVVAVAGWLWALGLPNQYDASARVYVNTDTALRPLMKNLTVAPDTLSQVGLVTQAMLSRPQLEAVATETGLDSRARTPEQQERMLEGLKQKISITRMPKQDIYSIAYRDRDPKMARDVVQALLTNFMQNSLLKDRTDSAQAQGFLRGQIRLYEQRLVEAEDRLAEFKKRNVGLMPGQGGGYYDRLQSAQAQVRMVQGEVTAAESRRAELMRQVEGEEPVLGMATQMGGGGATSVDGEIGALEAKLNELLVTYTEKHPEVTPIKQKLDQLYARREEERASMPAGGMRQSSPLDTNPVYQTIRVALSTTEAELATLRATLREKQGVVANLRRQVDTVPEVEAELNRLNRDYDVIKEQYDALVQRLESARLAEEVQADNEEVTFDVIEPPRLPLFPASPNRLLLFTGVLLGAIGASFAAAFLMNQHNPVFFSGRRLRSKTGLPVFGSVARTNSYRPAQPLWVFPAALSALIVTFLLLLSFASAGLKIPGLS